MTLPPILCVDHAPAIGGAERILLDNLKHLHAQGTPVHLACPPGGFLDEAGLHGIAVHPLVLPRLRRSRHTVKQWWSGIHAIVDIARQTGAALLLVSTIRAAVYTAPAALLLHRPFVWYFQDFWLSESRPKHLWADRLGKRLLCLASRHIIAISQATARHLPCARKVSIVHSGVDIPRYDPAMDGQPFRREVGIPETAPVIGVVGRLRPWKGQDRFLRVLVRVRASHPDAWGLVVGGNPLGEDDGYSAALRRLAETLGLRDHVVFTGQLADPRPALAAMDIFVHPGDPEPFGLVNTEAMAMGKPVVAFAHGALPEIVDHDITGVLVPPADEEAMASALIALLNDPLRTGTMGRAARVRAEAHFAVSRTVREVETILKRLLPNRPKTLK